jgi:tripartite ATP-independent transporter DctP family solute receptor
MIRASITRRHALTLALAGAVGLAGGFAVPSVADAQTRQMVIAVIYGPKKPQALVWYRMQELLDKSMPGRFKLKIVTNGALGGEKETTEGIRLGSIQGAESTLANLTTWVPEGALFDMPFMFRDLAHIDKVMKGPIGDEFKKKYEAQGVKVLGYIVYGARHLMAKKPVLTPDDAKNLKIRVLQSDLHIQLWRHLGANPAPVPITETYNALETGVVDMMDMTKSGYDALKLYEVAPHFSETGHIWALGVLYVGTQFWNGLNADEKAALQAAADEAVPYFNKLAADEQAAGLAVAVGKGAKVHKVDAAVWSARMADFWKSYAPKVGGMERIVTIVETK